MAQFPALPLWTDAYLADTRHLTTEQHGAYLLLLMEAWRRPSCSLPDDDALLSRLSGLGERWEGNREAVMAFWNRDGRKKEWTQKRLVQERDYVASKSRSQRDKAAKRWKITSKDDAVAMPEGMPEECPNDAPTPTPTIVDTNVSTTMSEPAVQDLSKQKAKGTGRRSYTPEYEAFWKAYPSTEGQSKLNGFKAWQRLSAMDREAAHASLPSYAALLAKRPDRPVKHVEGYLSGRMFESFLPAATSSPDWARRLTYARKEHEWPVHHWGPIPGQSGCRAPAELLRPGDGDGWQEARAA